MCLVFDAFSEGKTRLGGFVFGKIDFRHCRPSQDAEGRSGMDATLQLTLAEYQRRKLSSRKRRFGMLQTHPSETRTSKSTCPAASSAITNVLDFDTNAIAWLLMGDVRSLLHNDVEEAETADWLQTTLTKLVPVLQWIQESQSETGALSNHLHANPDTPETIKKRFRTFRTLTDTLDELMIRLAWNLPVTELIPFAELRLAHWMADVTSFADRQLCGASETGRVV
jgi:hypothetical protein